MTPEEEKKIYDGVRELKSLFEVAKTEDPFDELSTAVSGELTAHLRLAFNTEFDDRTLGLIITQVAGVLGKTMQTAGMMGREVPAEVYLFSMSKAAVDLLGMELMDDDR